MRLINKINGVLTWGLFFSLSAGLYAKNDASFDRYKIILEKQPFGKEPIDSGPAPTPTPSGPSWVEDYSLTMLTENEDGSISIGLWNKKTQTSIILGVGDADKDEGIELVSADYEKSEVELKKGEEVKKLSANSSSPPSIPQARQGGPISQAKPRIVSARKSYAERRAERRRQLLERRKQQASQQNAPAPQPKYTGDELQQHLEEYQMEVIRKGLPPLPIPLTEDMDEQLVEEGVLPPAE